MDVAVCIVTYRRPQALARLLDGLNQLSLGDDQRDIRCIVVDNDEADSARAACEVIRPHFRWKLECYVEPRRGIPYGRNAAVAHAGDSVDFLVFIHDDEVAERGWLEELLRAQGRYDADVVAGPVIPRFTDPVPEWMIEGRLFERRRYATGHLAARVSCRRRRIHRRHCRSQTS